MFLVSSVKKKKKTLESKIEIVRPRSICTYPENTMTEIRYFKVTLTLNFRYHYDSFEDAEREYNRGYESEEEYEARKKDYEETDELFRDMNNLIQHVKDNDPLGFVEYIPDDEVISAEWDPKEFKIHFIIKVEDPSRTKKEIRSWIRDNSLEDGEYESCGDNGWVVTTLKEKMEYGLTDYRDNPIIIEQVDAKTVIAAA